MSSCSVQGCDVKSKDVLFFEFPTSRSHRRRWLDVMKLAGKLTTGSMVCSQHFTENDYESVRGKVRLKRKVVPSLLLADKKAAESAPSPKPEATDTTTPAAHLPNTTVKHSTTEHNKTIETDNCKTNGVEGDGISDDKTCSPNPITEPDPKQDIEEMITNYQIKNKPNSVLAASIDEDLRALRASDHERALRASEPERAEASEIVDVDVDVTPDVIMLPEVKPVFIEISVDKDGSASEPGAGSQDCLMLLESVQVDVDPTSLMLPERGDDDDEDDKAPDKKEDPISLLTSSDEDDVIIEEPHIDTVEVSDETDEDDMPLTRLVKKKTKKSKKAQTKRDKTLSMVMWGGYDFYCVQCHYTTPSKADFKNHVASHSTVIQICAICSYTTASKAQYSRHMRKHKEEKLFRCHLCGYKAKHNMSLIYHLKSHDKANLESVKRGFKCKKCNFKSGIKSIVLKHVRLCSTGVKKYSCDNCEYETARRSDLKRHQLRKHKEVVEEVDEDEYWP